MPKQAVKNLKLSTVSNGGEIVPEARRENDETCGRCFGSGMEVVEGKGARVCECKRNQTQSNLLVMARLPNRYAGCHFHNYRAQNASQETAFSCASRLTMDYPAVDRGLLFSGSVGVGKTHLAVSILKSLTERGFGCLFYEFGSLLKEIQGTYNSDTKTSEIGLLTPVLTTEILVLDELGASKPTDWVRDTMAHIINSRYNDQKLTIFTTNFLDETNDSRDETLEDRIGSRLRSRLFEMCRTIKITGGDYRRSFDNQLGGRSLSDQAKSL